MCIIVRKKNKNRLPKDIWEECFRCNKDGAGFAYIDGGEIVVKKGFMTFEAFWEAFKLYENRPALVHFRISTAGKVDEANCHPFLFKSVKRPRYQWAVAHNGRLPWASTATQSDTACFLEGCLFPHLERDPYFLDADHGIWMLERIIGDANKMSIIRYDKETNEVDDYIINEEAGNNGHGCWFSNWSWKGYHRNIPGRGIFADDWWDRFHAKEPITIPDPDGTNGWRKNSHGFWVNSVSGMAVIGGAKMYVGTNEEALEKVGHNLHPSYAGPAPTNLTLTDGSQAGTVQVPRDEGVLDKDEAEDDAAFISLRHLNKKERKDLRRMAADHMKNMGHDMKGLSVMDKIKVLRSDIRELWPTCKQLADEGLDKFILGQTIAEINASMSHKAGRDPIDVASEQAIIQREIQSFMN